MTENTGATPDLLTEIASLICVAKGYDPYAPVGENRVQWQTFSELAKSTLALWTGRSASSPNHADTGLVEAAERIREAMRSSGLEYAPRHNCITINYDDAATLLRALASIPDPERMDAWQPIGTAPDDEWIWAFEDGAQFKARYVSEGECWEANCGQPVVWSLDPTHWQPLPAPPRKALSGDKA